MIGNIARKELSRSATVHSVVVACRLLEYLAETGRAQRVTDIAAHLGMTKARVSRHLSTLTDLGMVAKMPDNSGYRLGPMLFQMANAALDQYEITNIANRYMVMLRNQITESLLLAIPAGGDALIVSTLSSGKPFSPQLTRGTRWSVPISPTARVILAFSEDHVRERVLARRTEREAEPGADFNRVDMRRTIERIRSCYHEYDEDPHEAGFSALCAPIFNHSDRIEAALTIVMPRHADGVSSGRDERYLRLLKETAVEISRALGCKGRADAMLATI